jgi:Raf kinase inhibitor-like YbhB/YbcL family protein
MGRTGTTLFLLVSLALAAPHGAGAATEGGTTVGVSISIRSPAFAQGAMVPSRYTCDGADLSPPLDWDAPPAGTASLALIVEDPDAPGGTWSHWVVYDLPPHSRSLPEAVPAEGFLENNARQGINDFHKIGYGGPCPPGGTHRYYFRLYALDIRLDSPPGLSREKLLKAIQGHVLAEGDLMGKYRR